MKYGLVGLVGLSTLLACNSVNGHTDKPKEACGQIQTPGEEVCEVVGYRFECLEGQKGRKTHSIDSRWVNGMYTDSINAISFSVEGTTLIWDNYEEGGWGLGRVCDDNSRRSVECHSMNTKITPIEVCRKPILDIEVCGPVK